MTATTETGTLAQDGYYDASAGTWTSGSGLSIEETLSTVAGFRFTGFTVGPARAESGTVTLRIVPTAAQVPVTVKLYAQGDSNPSAFSNTNGPLLENQMSLTSDLLLDSQTFTTPGGRTVTFDLDVPLLNAAMNMTEEWQGALNLTLHVRTNDGTGLAVDESESGQSATLSMSVERTLFSGIDVSEQEFFGSQSAAAICPLTGHEALKEDLVWSEYLRDYVMPGQEDPDTDELRPVRGRYRLINER